MTTYNFSLPLDKQLMDIFSIYLDVIETSQLFLVRGVIIHIIMEIMSRKNQ